MSRRDPHRARVLGLWTAGWLAAFLLAGMFRLGEPTVQWPVLAVPLLWALVALRPRRPTGDDMYDDSAPWPPDARWQDDPWQDDEGQDDRDVGVRRIPPHDPRRQPRPAERTDTVERPAVHPPSWDEPRDRRRRS